MQRDYSKYDYISYKYEFPGGKVEEGESWTSALMREIREEMDLDLNVNDDDYFMTVKHEYPDFAITMHCYLCQMEHRAFTLKEHISYKWMKPSLLEHLDWAEADRPVVVKLMETMV